MKAVALPIRRGKGVDSRALYEICTCGAYFPRGLSVDYTTECECGREILVRKYEVGLAPPAQKEKP